MKDGHLALISIVMSEPGRPLKYYVDLSGVSRATFFKAKRELGGKGALFVGESGLLDLDNEAARRFIEAKYPGLSQLFAQVEAKPDASKSEA